MSIYNRSYMHDDFRPKRVSPPFNALVYLLGTLVGVYVVQMILAGWVNAKLMTSLFGLSVHNLLHFKIHTLITYGYLHEVGTGLPLHLLINGVFLYIFGKMIQEESGPVRFLEIFNFCVLTGGIIALGSNLLGPNRFVMGASGGVSGLIALFALHRWNTAMELLLFFVFPVRVTGKMLFYGLLAIEGFFFLTVELPGIGNTAYSAHLGGILGAYLYNHFLIARPTLTESISSFLSAKSSSQHTTRHRKSQKVGRFKVNIQSKPAERAMGSKPRPANLKNEVNRILDKINEQGFGTLTKEEKRILEEAKDRLK